MRQVVILGRQTHEVGTSVLVASFPIPVRSSLAWGDKKEKDCTM